MEGAHNVIITVNEEFSVASEDDLWSTILGEEYLISNVDHDWSDATVFIAFAGANSHDSAIVKLLLGLAGEDDATLSLGDHVGFLVGATVQKWS